MDKYNENVLFQLDYIHCRQLLPIEAWDLITKRSNKSPDAFQNLINSSFFFRSLLAEETPIFLLEKVLAILIPTIWNNEGEKLVTNYKLLKFRQLNSRWNRLIDNLFMETFKLQDGKDCFKICQTIHSLGSYNFNYHYTRPKLLNFLDHFQTTHSGQIRSPFICPELSVLAYTISCHINPDEQEFLEQISTLLQRYGSHVRQFNLKIEGAALIRCTNTLQLWVGLLKNLKGLKIICDDLAREARHVAKIRFPTFYQLKYLETSKLPAPFFNKIIHQNCHVQTLNIRTWEENYNFVHSLDVQSERRTFYNLKTLKFSIDSRGAFDQLASPLVQFPVLTKLTLWFGASNNTKMEQLNVSWSEIFQMIQNKFAKTLENVFLKLPFSFRKVARVQNYQDSQMFRLYLPKLKEISLVLWNHTSLDFLLPIRNVLETLKLDIRYSEGDEIKMTIPSVVQLEGFTDKARTFNIPYLFNNLKQIEIRMEDGKTRQRLKKDNVWKSMVSETLMENREIGKKHKNELENEKTGRKHNRKKRRERRRGRKSNCGAIQQGEMV